MFFKENNRFFYQSSPESEKRVAVPDWINGKFTVRPIFRHEMIEVRHTAHYGNETWNTGLGSQVFNQAVPVTKEIVEEIPAEFLSIPKKRLRIARVYYATASYGTSSVVIAINTEDETDVSVWSEGMQAWIPAKKSWVEEVRKAGTLTRCGRGDLRCYPLGQIAKMAEFQEILIDE